MKKITKQEENCPTCGHTTKWEESEEFCDECEKQVLYDKEFGYPMTIRFILHDANGMFSYSDNKDFNFCSVRHGFKWLRKNAKKMLKHKDDFFTMDYWHKHNVDELFKILRVI